MGVRPTIDNFNTSIVATEDQAQSAAGVLLAAMAQAGNPDQTGFAGGAVLLHLAGATSTDSFTIAPGTTSSGAAVTLVGSSVYVNNALVGSFSGGAAGSDLSISLISTRRIDRSEVSAILDSLTLRNSSDNPVSTARTISLSLTDADSDTLVSTATYTITPVNDPPTIDGGVSTLTITETAANGGVFLEPSAQVGNPDQTGFGGGSIVVHLAGATASDSFAIVAGTPAGGSPVTVSGSSIFVNGVLFGTLTGGTAGSDLSIQFVNTRTVDRTEVSSVLDRLQVVNSSGNPVSGARNLSVTLTDHDNDHTTQAIAYTITPVASPPTIDGGVSTLTITETAANGGVFLEPSAQVGNPDQTAFGGGSIVVHLAGATASDSFAIVAGTPAGGSPVTVSGSSIFVNGVLFGTLTGGTAGSDLSIQFVNTRTVDRTEVSSVLDRLQVVNSSGNPVSGARNLSVTLTDHDNDHTTQAIAYTITPVASPPTIDGGVSTLTITETAANGGVFLEPSAQVGNPDQTGFGGGSIVVHLAGATASDSFAIVAGTPAGGSPVTVSGSSIFVNGVLFGTLTGGTAGSDLSIQFVNTRAVDRIEVSSVLDQLQLLNSSGNPVSGARNLSVTLTDHDNDQTTQTIAYTITPVASPPTIDGGVSTLTITEDQAQSTAGVFLEPSVQVGNPDQTGFGGGSLVVHLAGATATDSFAISAGTPTGGSPVTITGSNIFVNGVLFGTFTGGTAGSDLTVQFVNTRTVDRTEVSSVLDQLTLRNSSDNPSGATRNLSVVLTDHDGDHTTQTVSYTITPVNDPAIVANNTVALTEGDTAAAISTSGVVTVTDPDSPTTITAQNNVAGSYGNFSITSDGHYTYTASSAHNEFVGGVTYTESFAITTADGTTSAVTITIGGTDDAAVVSSASVQLTEGNTAAAISTSGTLTVTDPDSSTSFIPQTGTAGNYGSLSIDAAGHYTYTASSAHDEFRAGTVYHESFTVGTVGGAATSVRIDITGTDDAPVLTGANPAISIAEGAGTTTISAISNVTDPETDALSLVNVPTNIAGVSTSGTSITFDANNAAYDSLANGQSTQVAVTYGVSDGTSTTPDSVTFTVTGTNDAPTVTATALTVNEDTSANPMITVGDVDNGDTLIVSVSASHGTLNGSTSPASYTGSVATVNAQLANLRYQDGADLNGSEALTIVVTDNNGGAVTATQAITVTSVEDAPRISAPNTAITIAEGAATTFLSTTNVTDPDANTTLTLTDLATVAGVSATGNVITFDANNSAYDSLAVGQSTQVAVTYGVSDGTSTVADSVTFTVTGTNDAPTVTATALTVNEDTSAHPIIAVGDVDNGDVVTVHLAASNGTLSATDFTGSVASVNGALSALTYQDSADRNGSESIVITVTDNHSGTVTATQAISVTPVEDAPRISAPNTAITIAEGAATTFLSTTNVTDPDANTTLTLTNLATIAGVSATGNVITFDANNSAYDSLAVGQSTQVAVTYGVSDGTSTVADSVTFTVTGTNDAPTVTATALTVNEDTSANPMITVGDVDNGDTLIVSVSASHGTLNGSTSPASYTGSVATVNAQLANLRYQDGADLNGSEALTIVVTDNNGGAVTATQAITVTSVEDAPRISAPNTAITIAEGAATTFLSTTNVTDPDANTTLTLTDLATVAGVSATGNVITFDANNSAYDSLAVGQSTQVAVTYGVSDGTSTVADSVTFTVTGTNDAPTVTATPAQTNEDISVHPLITVGDVDNGDTVTVAITASNGTLSTSSFTGTVATVNAALNNLTYQDAADLNGTETLSITVTDNHGGTTSATQLITVNPVEDAPRVSGTISATVAEGSMTSVDGVSNASDPDASNVLTVTNVPTNIAGVSSVGNSITLDASNAAYDHLAQGASANVVVTYGVTDGQLTTSDTVTFTVTGVNDAPMVTGGITGSVTEGTGVTSISAVSNAADVDDNTTLIVGAAGGLPAGVTIVGQSFQIDTNNAAYNHLAAGDTATVTVSYTVSDGIASAVPDTATFTITGTNDAPVNTVPTSVQAQQGVVLPITSITVADVDDNSTETVDVSVAHGTLAIGGVASGATVTSSNAFENIRVVGTVTQVNASLANLTYTSLPGFAGTDIATVSTQDGHGVGGTDADSFNILVNAPPMVTVTPITATEDTAVAIGGAITVSDQNVSPNNSPEDTLTVDVTATRGTLTETGVTGTGTGHVTITGTVSAVNTALSNLMYKDGANLNGTEALSVAVHDNHGGTASLAVSTVTVTAVNDTPTVTASNFTVNEDTSTTLGITVGDPDSSTGNVRLADGTTATADPSIHDLTVTVAATVGTIDGTSSHTYSGTVASVNTQLAAAHYQDALNANGFDTISVTVTDGTLTTSTIQTVTVTHVNDAPVVAGPLTATATENGPTVSVNGLTGASDVDTATTNTRNADGTAGTDPDSHTLSVTNVAVVSGVTVSGNSITLDPNNGAYDHIAAGTSSDVVVTYAVSDGTTTTPNSVTFTINGVNDAPVITPPAAIQDNQYQTYTVTGLSVADKDDGDTQTVVLAVNQGTLSATGNSGATVVTGAGGLNLTVTGDLTDVNSVLNTLKYASTFSGTDTLRISTTDGHGGQDVRNTIITTNPAPVFNESGAVHVTNTANYNYTAPSVPENTATGTPAATITATDSNPNGTTVAPTLALVTPTVGDAAYFNFDPATGNLTFKASPDFEATHGPNYTVGITATDSLGGTATEMVTITVSDVNEAPVVTAPTSTPTAGTTGAATEDTVYNFSNSIQIADQDTAMVGVTQTVVLHVDHGTLTLGSTTGGVVSGNASTNVTITGTAAQVNADLNGLIYKDDLNRNGVEILTITDTDSGGLTQSGSPTTVTINVTGVNDAPTITAAPFTVNEDTSHALGITVGDVDDNLSGTVSVNNASGVDPNASQVTVTVSATVGTVDGTSATPGTSHSDTFTGTLAQANAHLAGLYYQDALNQNGIDTLVISVNDGTNAVVTTTETITVTHVNDAPTATPNAGQPATENGTPPVTFDALANVTDVDTATNQHVSGDVRTTDQDSSVLTVALTGTTPAGVGLSGSIISFDPDNTAYEHLSEGSTQPVVVSYTVSDTHGGVLPETVTFTVTGVNDAPVFVGATTTLTVNEDASGQPLVTFTDKDDSDTYTVTVTASHGTLNGETTPFTYVGPATTANAALLALNYQDSQDRNGPETLVYSVNDGHTTVTATQSVMVTHVNDGPVVSGTNTGPTATENGAAVTFTNALTNASDVDNATSAPGVSSNNSTGMDADSHSLTIVNFNSGGAAGVTQSGNDIVLDPNNAAYDHIALGASQVVVVSYGVTDTMTTVADSVTFTVNGINDTPVNAIDATAVTFSSNTPTYAFNTTNGSQIGVSDADDNNTVTVQLSVQNGTLHVNSGTGVTEVDSQPTVNNITLTGNSHDVDAVLHSLTYTANPGATSDLLRVATTDDHGATDADNVGITITANQAPAYTAATGDADHAFVGQTGTPVTGTLTFLDADDTAVMTYAITGETVNGQSTTVDTALTISPTTSVSGNHDLQYSFTDPGMLNGTINHTYIYTITATDTHGASSTHTIEADYIAPHTYDVMLTAAANGYGLVNFSLASLGITNTDSFTWNLQTSGNENVDQLYDNTSGAADTIHYANGLPQAESITVAHTSDSLAAFFDYTNGHTVGAGETIHSTFIDNTTGQTFLVDFNVHA